MPAHLRDLDRQCEEPGGCPHRARLALYNARNALLGYYCGRHGPRRLRALLRRSQGQERQPDRGPRAIQIDLEDALAELAPPGSFAG